MQYMKANLRDVLIDHIDGPQPYHICENYRGRQVRGAVQSGYLKFDRLKNPKTTTITEKGRTELCRNLAQWAEALIRAEQRGLDLLALKSPDLTP